jgi:hypothetical protein
VGDDPSAVGEGDANPLLSFLAQFDVPVSEVEEMFPTVVVTDAEVYLDKRSPFGPFWLANQVHAGFGRGAIGFAGITANAGADDVFPSGWTTAFPRCDVVEIQVFAFENLSTILASILVSFEDIVPSELDLFLRHTIKKNEENDARNADLKGDRADAFRMGFLLGEVMPFGEAVGLEGSVISAEDNLSMTFEEER